MRVVPLFLLAGLTLIFLIPEAISESGGPDSFGYTFKDSSETDGPTYSWIDVSSNGTHINLGGDGDTWAPLGFDFFFYGNWYDQWWLSGDNGLITLDEGVSNYWNEKPIPDIDNDMVAIAPFWSDLQQCSTEGEDGVYYQLIGNETNQALVIQYQGFKEYGGSNCNGKAQYNFQIIIFENTGNLIFNYKPDFENGVPERSVSIGIQGNHETGLQYYYGVKENLSSNFSILFEPNYNLVNRLQIIDIVSPGGFSYGVNEETFVTIKNIGRNDVSNINFNLKFISQDNIVIHNTTKNIEFIEGKNKINISKIITPAQFDLIPGENITIRCSLKLGNSSQIIDMMETNVLVKYMFFEERFQGNYGVHPWYGDWDYSESDNWERTGYSIGTGEDLSMFSGYRCNGNRPTLSSITSPSIDLTLGKNVWMEFSHSYYFYSSYSGARLEIGLGEGNGPITGWWPLRHSHW